MISRIFLYFFDGLVKSPIYFVVGLARQFAVPYVLPNCRARHYASYIDLFPEPIRMVKLTFYQIIFFAIFSFLTLAFDCTLSDVQAAEINIAKKIHGSKTEFILNIINASKLAGLKVSVTYQHQYLKFSEAVKTTEMSSFLHIVNDKVPGKLIIVMASAKGISGQNIPVLHLNFDALQSAVDTADLHITGCELMDESLQNLPCDVKRYTD
jgi:hypothetical protein